MTDEKPSWLKGRQKGCVTPAAAPADYDPAATYDPWALVKIGDFVAIPLTETWAGRTPERMMWIYTAYGTRMTHTSFAMSLNTINTLAITSAAALTVKFAKASGGENYAGKVALNATFAATNLKVMSNLAWVLDPPSNGNLTYPWAENFTPETGDRIFRCLKRTVGASSLTGYTTPGNFGVFPREHSNAPSDTGYWEELVGYSPEDVSVARTDCQTINPFEARTCGRCGRPM